LAEHAGLKEGATVVVDRGMAYDENIAELKKRKLHYVVASWQLERDRWLADFEDTEGFTPVLREPSPLNPGHVNRRAKRTPFRGDRHPIGTPE
jgi:hypothetical protein